MFAKSVARPRFANRIPGPGNGVMQIVPHPCYR
jgi:hypothetical protein